MQYGLIKVSAAALLALAVSSCGASPKQQLAADCRKGGNTKETCKCFVDSLSSQLNDKQLAALAKAGKEKSGGGQAALENMEMAIAGAVMGAAKKCNLTGAPSGM